MAEQKTWMRAVITGRSEDGHGNVVPIDTTQEGEGIICIAAREDGCGGAVLGAWSGIRAETALRVIKKGLGREMFTKAMLKLQLEEIFDFCEDNFSAEAEEEENEKKAAAAAGEVHDGEEA